MAQQEEKKLELVRSKVTKCGNYYEVRHYELPYVRGFSVERRPKVLRKPRERRADAISRARNTLVRKVLANSTESKPVFVTLTYVENMVDRQRAVDDTRRFIASMRALYGRLGYVYVLERQKRGAWHVHLLIFRKWLDIKSVRVLWQSTIEQDARVNIKPTNDAKHVAFYLGKYLGKDTEGLMSNKRSFSGSRGLLTPTEYTNHIYRNDIRIPQNCIYSGGYFTPRGDFVIINIFYEDERNISRLPGTRLRKQEDGFAS